MAAAKMDPGRTKLPDRQYRARHHFLAHCFASGQPPGFHMASSLPFHLSELTDDKAEKRHPVKGTPATLCSFLCVLLLRMPSAFSSKRHWIFVRFRGDTARPLRSKVDIARANLQRGRTRLISSLLHALLLGIGFNYRVEDGQMMCTKNIRGSGCLDQKFAARPEYSGDGGG